MLYLILAAKVRQGFETVCHGDITVIAKKFLVASKSPFFGDNQRKLDGKRYPLAAFWLPLQQHNN